MEWELGEGMEKRFQGELWPAQTEPCVFMRRILMHKEEADTRGGFWFVPQSHVVCKASERSFGREQM